jgi:hypothetical protein
MEVIDVRIETFGLAKNTAGCAAHTVDTTNGWPDINYLYTVFGLIPFAIGNDQGNIIAGLG